MKVSGCIKPDCEWCAGGGVAPHLHTEKGEAHLQSDGLAGKGLDKDLHDGDNRRKTVDERGTSSGSGM